ncbi:hypothetical protein LO762_21950 [Actinocorallia sp. API 0066]|uniref:hypothetical protein n=1 Tax=Actinocorallia sp. API 0066 TaxID=2896846 RepID=UPI001E58FB1A|nr:hypothetical protein [Actinocorallia sp. API 0066]MCD0451838.1 hypothetical protein [Actinocorallia sp. API 0066]
MQKSAMVADYLQQCARWRLDRAGTADDRRDARCALALLDAAAHARALSDSDRTILRLHAAGCFVLGRYSPGVEGERLVRFWHYEEPAGEPEELLALLVDCAERARNPVPAQRTPS